MDDRHAADRRGFGSITLPGRRGLPCRHECGRIFRRVDDDVSLVALLAAATDRDDHERRAHGGTFVRPAVAPRRRRHLVYGKAVGAE